MPVEAIGRFPQRLDTNHLLERHGYKIIGNGSTSEDALIKDQPRDRHIMDQSATTCESRFLYDAVSCVMPYMNDRHKHYELDS